MDKAHNKVDALKFVCENVPTKKFKHDIIPTPRNRIQSIGVAKTGSDSDMGTCKKLFFVKR